MVNIPFKSIIFFCLGSFRATLLDLNNLFLISLFMGFVRSIPYLFINKVAVFQPFYSIIFFMEDPRPDYIIFFLYFIVLLRNFAPLFDFPFIYGLTPLYRLMFKVIWFFGFIFCCFCYTPIYFLSLVSAFVPYFSPQILFTPPGGFIFINFLVHPLIYAFISASNPVNN